MAQQDFRSPQQDFRSIEFYRKGLKLLWQDYGGFSGQ